MTARNGEHLQLVLYPQEVVWFCLRREKGLGAHLVLYLQRFDIPHMKDIHWVNPITIPPTPSHLSSFHLSLGKTLVKQTSLLCRNLWHLEEKLKKRGSLESREVPAQRHLPSFLNNCPLNTFPIEGHKHSWPVMPGSKWNTFQHAMSKGDRKGCREEGSRLPGDKKECVYYSSLNLILGGSLSLTHTQTQRTILPSG